MNNVYQHHPQEKDKEDVSPHSSSGYVSSRRGSASLVEGLRELVRKKHKTVQQAVKKRRMSVGSHGLYSVDSDSEGERGDIVRKFSAPAPDTCPPLSADYAIMRHTSKLWEYELITTIDKGDDPYRQYLQSVTCYDVAPAHSMVVVLDGEISLHKALIAVQQSPKPTALVLNADRQIDRVFSHTDCLQALLCTESDNDIGERSLSDYLAAREGSNKMLSANAMLSLWEASRVFCKHRIHRLPITHFGVGGFRETDILYLLSLKDIFAEPLVRKLETHWKIAPYMRETLADLRVGCWGDVETISSDSDLRTAIQIMLDKGVSSLPVVDDDGGAFNVLTKQDVTDILAEKNSTNYLDALTMTAAEAIATRTTARLNPFCAAEDSIGEAMEMIALDHYQCLFALDSDKTPLAAVSVVDLMQFIVNWAEED